MTESRRIARVYRRLTNCMNVPLVDQIVRSLRNRDIPYDTRLRTFDNQNSKT